MDRFGIFTRRVYSLWYYALFLVVRRLLVVVSFLSFSFSLFERTKALSAPSDVVVCRSFSPLSQKNRGFFLSILFRVFFQK